MAHVTHVNGADVRANLVAGVPDLALMGLAVSTVGACRRILDLVVAHVKQRKQFGVPIGSFQAVKHKAADMYVAVQPFRSMTGTDDVDFNEVFFTDVLVPKENLIGELNKGLAVAHGSLGHERTMLWINYAERLDDLIRDAPSDQEWYATLQMDVQALRLLGYEQLSGGDNPAEISVLKLFGSGGAALPEKITLEWIYKLEARKYLEYSLRWRNAPKPSIAAVQGKCIAGGLLLCWPCDLIIAAENAEFSDPVVLLGIGGVEYRGHTWELGPRKAKEILFTGRAVTAREAEQTGMDNRVVPLDRLADETMELAGQISRMHPFALRQAKRAVNQTLDIQGFYAAIQSVFDIHHTGHGNALSVGGYPILTDLANLKEHIKSQ